MPLATRPNQKYEFVLTTDMELPEKSRPVFIFRYLNVLDWEKIAEINDDFDKTKGTKILIEQAFKVIEKTLVDWRNMKNSEGQEVGFNLMLLKSMLSLAELTELMMAAVAQRPSVEDKKKLSSPSALNTAPATTPAKNAATAKSANSAAEEKK